MCSASHTFTFGEEEHRKKIGNYVCVSRADEAVFTPLHVGIFFALLTIADGGNLADVKAKFRKDYVSTLLTELIVWPG